MPLSGYVGVLLESEKRTLGQNHIPATPALMGPSQDLKTQPIEDAFPGTSYILLLMVQKSGKLTS